MDDDHFTSDFPCPLSDDLFQFTYAPLPPLVGTGNEVPMHNPGSSLGHIKNSKEKKASHNDIEKQRRQEMSALYRSLRSLLPIEYLKGRRSISDHIHESGNYIMYLKKNIKELNEKRDRLKMLQGIQRGCLENVRVTPSWPGVEVAVETDFKEGFPLWRLVEILVEEEELSVVSCVSTKVNEKFLHTIKAEVSQGRANDLFQLQQKLSNLEI